MAETYSVEAYLKAIGVDKFGRDFRNATKDVQGLDKSTGSAGLTIGKLIGAIGITTALAKGFGMVKESVETAFERIDTMEQFSRVMNVMVGDTDKVNDALERTREAVTGTAYTLDGAASAVQNFVTRGVEIDKATGYIESWGDAVAFYGNGSNEQFANVTNALQNMIAKGTVGMDQLNRVTEAGIPAVEIYADAVGMSSGDVQEALSKGEISAEQFVDTVTKAMKEGGDKFPSIVNAAKEGGESWGAVFSNMRTHVATGVENIIKNIDKMLKDNNLPDMRKMFKKFGETFRDSLTRIGEAIPPTVEKIKEIYKNIKPWLPLIASIATAVFGMMTAWSAFNTVTNIINNVKRSFSLLNGVMKANPWILVIGAIIAAAILVYTYWEPISEFFMNLWQGIKEVATTVWTAIADFFVGIWEWIKEVFNNALIWINENVIERFSLFFEIISEYMQLIWENIKAAWDFIKNTFKNVLKFLKSLVTGDFEGMKNAIKSQMDNAHTLIKSIWNNIKSFFASVLTKIWTTVKNKFSDVVNSARTKMNEAKEKIEEAWNNAVKFLQDIDLLQIGKDIIQGLIDGIKDKVDAVSNAMKSVTDAITGKIKSILKIKSPSRVFMAFGKFLSEGLAIGIKKASGLATKATEALGTNVTDAFNPDLSLSTGHIASQVNSINRQAETRLNHTFESTLRVNKQPAYINVSIGGSEFEGFVDDITEVQDRKTRLRKAFA